MFESIDPGRDFEGEDVLILWWSLSAYLTEQGRTKEEQLAALGLILRRVGSLRLHVMVNLGTTPEQLSDAMRLLLMALVEFEEWMGLDEHDAYDAAWAMLEHFSSDVGGLYLYIPSTDGYLRRVASDLLSEGIDPVIVAVRTGLGLRIVKRCKQRAEAA